MAEQRKSLYDLLIEASTRFQEASIPDKLRQSFDMATQHFMPPGGQVIVQILQHMFAPPDPSRPPETQTPLARLLFPDFSAPTDNPLQKLMLGVGLAGVPVAKPVSFLKQFRGLGKNEALDLLDDQAVRALKYKNKVFVGRRGDLHEDIADRYRLPKDNEFMLGRDTEDMQAGFINPVTGEFTTDNTFIEELSKAILEYISR